MKTAKRQLNKHDAAEETTKRLESIMASFDAFDADMRIGTRQRREKDEFKVFTSVENFKRPSTRGLAWSERGAARCTRSRVSLGGRVRVSRLTG